MKTFKQYIREDYTNDSAQAHELILHGDNDAHLYHSSHMPIVSNLKKKMKKGTYDSTKAKKLWGYHADRAAQSYAKEHGDKHTPWHKMFPPHVRKIAASHWEEHHRDELKEEFTPEETVILEEFGDEINFLDEAIKKGAFHRWLGKSEDSPITHADIKKGLAAGGHAAKMANFARNSVARLKEEVESVDEAKKGVSWNPPEVQAKAAKERKESKSFARAKAEINRLRRQGK